MAANGVVEALKEAFPGAQVVLPSTDEFTTLNTSYLSKAQAELEPRAIFLPRDRDDVVKFVRFIGPYALRGDIKFAVRGAGQQPALGCNNEHDGITVDLRNLTGIHLKDDDATVSIGAGERWGEVYSKLQEKGLAVTGSRSSLGGIGGLSLSGKDSRYPFSLHFKCQMSC
jgi:FAD/FMN-containing dehydrogenase